MRRDWEYKKLGEVVAPKNQIQRALKCFNKTDIIKYLDISSIDNSKYQISAYTEYALENAPSRAQQKVEINDIIISLVRPNLKNIARIEIKDHSLVASSGFCVLRTTELIDNNYLFYFISSQKYTDYLVGVTAGANYPAVKESDIRDSLIPIPPKSTQLAIVAELDKLNEMIRLKKQQLEDYDQLAQSIFYEMFGDPVENERGWEVKKLGEICELKAGKAIKANELSNDNIYPCYGGNGIRGYINKCSHTQSASIIGRQGAYCGTVNFAKAPFYATEHAVVVKELCNMNTKWLYYTLVNLKLSRFAKGQAQPGIAVSNLNELVIIPLPPLPLQHQFAARIETIEQQKQQVKDTIKDLETLLASRMQFWFD